MVAVAAGSLAVIAGAVDSLSSQLGVRSSRYIREALARHNQEAHPMRPLAVVDRRESCWDGHNREVGRTFPCAAVPDTQCEALRGSMADNLRVVEECASDWEAPIPDGEGSTEACHRARGLVNGCSQVSSWALLLLLEYCFARGRSTRGTCLFPVGYGEAVDHSTVEQAPTPPATIARSS